MIQVKTKILLSSAPDELAKELAKYGRTATVEAEYGDRLVSGSVETLAHHGSRSHYPAPCLYLGSPVEELEAVGLSHVDLDTLGGVAGLIGWPYGAECSFKNTEHPGFWRAAAFVDVFGSHKAEECLDWEEQKHRLQAFWAWSQENRVFAPRDGSVTDVTEKVLIAINTIQAILQEDPDLLEAGRVWAETQVKTEQRCFISDEGSIRVFAGDAFCNTFYRRPDGKVAEAIICFNTVAGSITLSFEDGGKLLNACKIVQSLWGSEAGGHAGIAGSPRDQRMTFKDLQEIFRSVETNLILAHFPGFDN